MSTYTAGGPTAYVYTTGDPTPLHIALSPKRIVDGIASHADILHLPMIRIVDGEGHLADAYVRGDAITIVCDAHPDEREQLAAAFA